MREPGDLDRQLEHRCGALVIVTIGGQRNGGGPYDGARTLAAVAGRPFAVEQVTSLQPRYARTRGPQR